jgi:hypothetical protein
MKSNWTQILVFTIVSLILGFVLGRVTGNGHGNMEKHIVMKHMDGDGEHMVWNGNDGEENVFMVKGGDAAVDKIIAQIEASNFTGDTIMQVGESKISISKKDGNMEVQVEASSASDGPKKEVRIEIKKD